VVNAPSRDKLKNRRVRINHNQESLEGTLSVLGDAILFHSKETSAPIAIRVSAVTEWYVPGGTPYQLAQWGVRVISAYRTKCLYGVQEEMPSMVASSETTADGDHGVRESFFTESSMVTCLAEAPTPERSVLSVPSKSSEEKRPYSAIASPEESAATSKRVLSDNDSSTAISKVPSQPMSSSLQTKPLKSPEGARNPAQMATLTASHFLSSSLPSKAGPISAGAVKSQQPRSETESSDDSRSTDSSSQSSGSSSQSSTSTASPKAASVTMPKTTVTTAHPKSSPGAHVGRLAPLASASTAPGSGSTKRITSFFAPTSGASAAGQTRPLSSSLTRPVVKDVIVLDDQPEVIDLTGDD